MWKDSKGRDISAERRGRVEYAPHNSDAVIISSNPALHVPNFDRCRKDKRCRCRSCKPSMVTQ